MRSEEEIRNVHLEFDNPYLREAEDHPANCEGDNFKFGFYIGKQAALGWMLGEIPSSMISSHFDFEDWDRETELSCQDQIAALTKQTKDLERLAEKMGYPSALRLLNDHFKGDRVPMFRALRQMRSEESTEGKNG